VDYNIQNLSWKFSLAVFAKKSKITNQSSHRGRIEIQKYLACRFTAGFIWPQSGCV